MGKKQGPGMECDFLAGGDASSVFLEQRRNGPSRPLAALHSKKEAAGAPP